MPTQLDKEIAAIANISRSLSELDDAEARQRVLRYVAERFLGDIQSPTKATTMDFRIGSTVSAIARSPMHDAPAASEIEGIARLSDTGELRITARDLKARNTLDAAVRLAHIAIYSHEKLTGKPLSSRKGLTPLMKEWRVYDGNTRNKLANERGVIRSGDNLSLDAHARRDAEQYIAEILDPEIEGRWKAR